MAQNTLYNKIWQKHKVATLPSGLDQLFVGLHYVHEVTSPQAFAALKEKGVPLAFPDRTFATIDHVIPTHQPQRPYADEQAELMVATLEKNVQDFHVPYFGPESGRQGIVHIIGPELGITQPGMTIACGDSHTSTHGALGALAFGMGTTEVQMVLETQTLALKPLKVRKIQVDGQLSFGVTAKDLILYIIRHLGINGGLGYAYEFTGSAIAALTMDERLTVCNMSIEGGARIGYINPDEVTFAYLKGKEFAPKGQRWDEAVAYWRSFASDPQAEFDDVVVFDAAKIEPMLTWGVTPGQAIGVSEPLPLLQDLPEAEQAAAGDAYRYMQLTPGQKAEEIKVDIVFIGACTNGRINDLREAARVLSGQQVKPGVRTLIVPGSQAIKRQAEAEGLDRVFTAAGAEWREPGCSLCLAMNPDKLIGDQLCAATSNRNFIGRQGSPQGRTVLVGPAMAAAAAIKGYLTDARLFLESRVEK